MSDQIGLFPQEKTQVKLCGKVGVIVSTVKMGEMKYCIQFPDGKQIWTNELTLKKDGVCESLYRR